MLIVGLISKGWNGIAMERLHRWGVLPKRDKPIVPERTRAELKREAERIRNERQ